MEATKEPTLACFAEVEPFTGEPESFPALTAMAQVPGKRSLTPFHTALTVQRPRNLDKIVAAVLREAEFAGDAFYYYFPMGGKKIEGPSIGLAMTVAREWGNCAVPVEYYETPGEWVFNAHFVDLERGFTVTRVFRKRKGKAALKKPEDDRAEDMTFQAAQSRAIRNVVLAGVPRWLTDKAKERAKEAVLKGINQEGLAAATEKSLKFLEGYGISAKRVMGALGKPQHQWTSEDIATLRGMASQLKDGQATAEQLFPPTVDKAEEKAKEEVKGKRSRPAKAEVATSSTTLSLKPPRAATPEQLEAIHLVCFEKEIDVELILADYRVSSLEELDEESAKLVLDWLESQWPQLPLP